MVKCRHRASHDVPIGWAPDIQFPGWLNPNFGGMIPKEGGARSCYERGDGTYDGDEGADGRDISHSKSLRRPIGAGRPHPLEFLAARVRACPIRTDDMVRGRNILVGL